MAPKRARSKCHDAASADSVKQLFLKHIPVVKLQELQGGNPEAQLFSADFQAVAVEHGTLLQELLQLDPFVTKSLLVNALVGYSSTLGMAITGEEWHRVQAYNLRQALSNIRVKAGKVKTGERQPACVQDLLKTFQRRRLLRRRSSTPRVPASGSVGGSGSVDLSRAPPESTQKQNSTASTPTSTRGLASKEEVWALYGYKGRGTEVVEVCSSTEEEVSSSSRSLEAAPPAAAEPQPTAAPVSTTRPHYDAHLNSVVRTAEDGGVMKALTQPGPNGFLIGTFDDGTTFESDVPNLALASLPIAEETAKGRRARTKRNPKQHKGEAKAAAKAKKAQLKTKVKVKAKAEKEKDHTPQDGGEEDEPASAVKVQDNFKLVRAKDKTYILEKNAVGKWVHMVSAYKTQAEDHSSIVEEIWGVLPMTKDQAIQMRDTLVRQHRHEDRGFLRQCTCSQFPSSNDEDGELDVE